MSVVVAKILKRMLADIVGSTSCSAGGYPAGRVAAYSLSCKARAGVSGREKPTGGSAVLLLGIFRIVLLSHIFIRFWYSPLVILDNASIGT
jgi:hypothetical protein